MTVGSLFGSVGIIGFILVSSFVLKQLRLFLRLLPRLFVSLFILNEKYENPLYSSCFQLELLQEVVAHCNILDWPRSKVRSVFGPG